MAEQAKRSSPRGSHVAQYFYRTRSAAVKCRSRKGRAATCFNVRDTTHVYEINMSHTRARNVHTFVKYHREVVLQEQPQTALYFVVYVVPVPYSSYVFSFFFLFF